jgi:serine/threonine protein phosphatase PrpC
MEFQVLSILGLNFTLISLFLLRFEFTYFLTVEPYVSITNLKENGDCPMLILACDGVWDVFTDQQAADLLMERYKKNGPFENAAEVLVQSALKAGSTDNITAIVVFL